jgi:HCOMODA/2-hydroxy-3-carboxy-muconic semialdehyde decarboxylase
MIHTPTDTPASTGPARGPQPGSDDELRRDLVLANRILVRESVLDGWGHVSVRSQTQHDHFYISRAKAPASVMLEDLIEVEVMTGEPVDAGVRTYVERHLHAGIYRAHPDVHSVVHSHSAGLIPFGLTGVPLRAIFHVAPFLASGTPIFEIRDWSEAPTDLLVSSPELGDALARTLEDNAMVLMRGHGAATVGGSIQQAVYRAVYAQQSAHLQARAQAMGQITDLSPAEVELAEKRTNDNLHRVWSLWAEEASERPLSS